MIYIHYLIDPHHNPNEVDTILVPILQISQMGLVLSPRKFDLIDLGSQNFKKAS